MHLNLYKHIDQLRADAPQAFQDYPEAKEIYKILLAVLDDLETKLKEIEKRNGKPAD